LGLFGTSFLILYGKSVGNNSNASWGNFLVLVNAISYGYYLVIVKKLMDKYNAFTFVKWIYLFGFLMVIPFGLSQFQSVDWAILPSDIVWKIGFVVVFSTFFTYLLNLLSMRELKPTLVAVFIYLQPLFATVFAISLGKDELRPVGMGINFDKNGITATDFHKLITLPYPNEKYENLMQRKIIKKIKK
jgi:drug/metabolite transporter (DMT)-like permease